MCTLDERQSSGGSTYTGGNSVYQYRLT